MNSVVSMNVQKWIQTSNVKEFAPQGNQKGKSSSNLGTLLADDGFRNTAKRRETLRNSPKYNRYRLCRP